MFLIIIIYNVKLILYSHSDTDQLVVIKFTFKLCPRCSFIHRGSTEPENNKLNVFITQNP